ncbi:uncharacterized protein SPPG_06577 [Spizellomyces punctatus DAOM BR117]|uniref:BHLH domain-containing protein n=1 Tax=Spizellomyces punctatus (strain DAOM BR117) TaxID=645134 RepID=A0A0L0HBR3_SPIPD|nr:uncharacterized protein SPPG_06577 [Spizellomyces punctatus DAOM BR117]KNC98173.1 hypothetical protein SPPG_06577 [Spizellomyces punctatus DAOM BR117]|eukprot:XP_016606213.1 hypothetical protein SPPG_06577 [Spizellomyces punctatus DAOM BR117]
MEKDMFLYSSSLLDSFQQSMDSTDYSLHSHEDMDVAFPSLSHIVSSAYKGDAIYSPYVQPTTTNNEDDEVLLTPLISPAMTPSTDFSRMTISQHNQLFSPLTSPALHPQDSIDSISLGFSFSSLANLDSISASVSASPSLPPMCAINAALSSPALPPSKPFQTPHVGASPALPPQNLEMSSPALVGMQSPALNGMASPGLAGLRERPKKTPLASPYIVPRKGALVSPALKPLRARSTHSPEATSSTTTTTTTTTTTSSSSTAPVFKTPFPVLPVTATSSQQQQHAAAAATLISPALTPQLAPSLHGLDLAPITPAQLMKLDGLASPDGTEPAPNVLNALVSPCLKPLLPNGSANNMDAALRLTQKSNYQNIKEGHTEQLGLKYNKDVTASVEARRDCHKQAEQRRRDSLKQCFDELRRVLPPIHEKNPSKVVVLKKCCEYIADLQLREQETERVLAELRRELAVAKGNA